VIEMSERAKRYVRDLLAFMDSHIYPAEPVYARQLAEADSRHFYPPVMDELKQEARRRGLWNLFHPDPELGAGLGNSEYAPLAEIMGRSPELAPEATNCSAPDTGNMEVLTLFGTDEQKDRYLRPFLDGTIRSAFAMTEPGRPARMPRTSRCGWSATATSTSTTDRSRPRSATSWSARPTTSRAGYGQATAGAPVETVFFWASIGGMPEEMVAERIRLLCRALAPRLASDAGGQE
jgi:Acyl-CoA dehydrogenase, N-terminal domain